jgi:hypothetical protein
VRFTGRSYIRRLARLAAGSFRSDFQTNELACVWRLSRLWRRCKDCEGECGIVKKISYKSFINVTMPHRLMGSSPAAAVNGIFDCWLQNRSSFAQLLGCWLTANKQFRVQPSGCCLPGGKLKLEL